MVVPIDKSAVAIDRVTLSSFRFFFWMQESFLVLPQFDIIQTNLPRKSSMASKVSCSRETRSSSSREDENSGRAPE